MKVEVVPEEEGEFPNPEHADYESDGRLPLHLLEEGIEMSGIITDIWLYHGVQVDFLGQWDG